MYSLIEQVDDDKTDGTEVQDGFTVQEADSYDESSDTNNNSECSLRSHNIFKWYSQSTKEHSFHIKTC